MRLEIEPCTSALGARIRGLDLRNPLDTATVDAIEDAIDQYAVVVFPGQPLINEQHVQFGLHFGQGEEQPQVFDQGRKRLDNDRMIDISNLDPDGNILKPTDRKRMFNLGNRLWHSDSSFKRVPASYSLLHAHVIAPEGGDTEFADMRAAWDMLPPAMQQRVETMQAEHSHLYSRALIGFTEFDDAERERMRPIVQPVVRTHPYSGRRSLFLSSHMGRIHGMEIPEGLDFIRQLMEHATQRQFVYRHRWTAGDLVMWDNRCTMHRVLPFDDTKYPRDMRRFTLRDDPQWRNRAFGGREAQGNAHGPR